MSEEKRAREAPLPELVTIFCGSSSRVASLEGLLAAEGIPSFVPDRMTKTLDPFITGFSPLESRLMVPAPRAEEALRIAAEAFPQPERPASPALRRRWRWIALLMIGPILAMWAVDLFTHLLD